LTDKKVITSAYDSPKEYLQKIWVSRHLIWLFAKRDIRIKYANTWLGISWTLLQPLTGLCIFTLLFSYVLKIESGNMAYPVYAFIGFNAWNFFSAVLNQGAPAVYQNQVLVTKVSFPKMVLNLSKVLTSGFDFLIAAVLLIALMPFFKTVPGWQIFFLPLVFLLNAVIGLTMALWLSALALKRRDLFHIIPYISSFGIWLTPVFYTMDIFPEEWQFVFYFNPMTTVVEAYRWCLSSSYVFDVYLLINIPVVAVLFVGAFLLYNRKEKVIVDYI
jgi:lipopolysaccharide transport system permease protein